MSGIRHRAVSAIPDAGLCCTLAFVVTAGINEGEIGDVVRYGVDNFDVVRTIYFQSAACFTGRFDIRKNYLGYGMQKLLNLIEAESGITADTFRSDHIGHAEEPLK